MNEETKVKKKDLAKKLFRGDVSVWIIFMLFCCFSLVEVFSATSMLAYIYPSIWSPIAWHASFLFAGFLFVLLLVHVHYKYFSLAILLLPVSILLLAVTPFIGDSRNEAYRFLPLFGFQFQPSEFGKFACVIYVAFLLSKRSKLSDEKTYKYILWGIAPVCLLIFVNNFSTAFILGTVCFLMMFIGQIPLKKLGRLLIHIAVLSLLFVLLLSAGPKNFRERYFPRFDTWMGRVTEYVEGRQKKPETEKNRKMQAKGNDQLTEAKIAIARGGIFGKLPGRSVQRDFLQQAYSDFIYAIIIEELGVAGGITVLFLYIMLLIRVGVIARRCEKLFPKYLVLGCGLIIVIQALVHISVNVGLVPVTGQPLPLISRGGTSTMLSCFYIGIILSVSYFGAKMGEEEDAEEDENDESEAEEDENPEENPIFAVETIKSEK
jgi:cell division protein FtsW